MLGTFRCMKQWGKDRNVVGSCVGHLLQSEAVLGILSFHGAAG